MPPLNKLQKTSLSIAISHAMLIPAHAADITVTSITDVSANDNVCSLREAIESAENNDSFNSGCITGQDSVPDNIYFDSGVFSGNTTISLSGSGLPTISSEINIKGVSGLTIDANSNGSVFTVDGGSLTIETLTISGGSATFGGGIRASNNSLIELDAVNLANNFAGFRGAGIYLRNSSLTLVDSIVSSNTVPAPIDNTVTNRTSGGGVFASSSSGTTYNININTSTIDSNQAGSGGGIYISGPLSVSINTSQVSNNSAAASGGGMRSYENTNTEISNSRIFGNHAGFAGGGIMLRDSTLKINSSSIYDNSAAYIGGGLYVSDSAGLANAEIGNSTFSQNTVGIVNPNTGRVMRGGAIATRGGSLTINNSTLSGNSAAEAGGGISIESYSPFSLVNTIVSGNSAMNNGNEIHMRFNYSTSLSLNHNLIGESSSSTSQALYNVSLGSNNTTTTSDGNQPTSLAGILQPLADNGGDTPTHLLAGQSPAINAGDNTVCANSLIEGVDQRGQNRQIDTHCDIGAIELTDEELEQLEQLEQEVFFVIPLPNDKSVIFGL